MTKQNGLGDHLLVAGYDFSGDIGSIQRVAGGPAALEQTGIDKSAYERIGGERDGGIDFTAWFNDAAGASHTRLSTLPTTDVIVTYLRGLGIGSPAASAVVKQIDYPMNRGTDGSLTMPVTTLANGYGVDWGQQVSAGIRTDTTATSPATGLDGGASTAFGAQFFLQVTALTGTSVTVTVQDSADNSTFAAIASPVVFTAATGPWSERIAITGTVRRYLRVITTGTFSLATFVVQASRNQTAVAF